MHNLDSRVLLELSGRWHGHLPCRSDHPGIIRLSRMQADGVFSCNAPGQNATGSATLLWQAALYEPPPNSQIECRITPGRPEPSRSALGPGVGSCLNDERKLVHQGWHTLHLPSMPALFTVGTPRKLSAQNSPATILQATRGNSQTSTFHTSTASTPVNNFWREPKSAL